MDAQNCLLNYIFYKNNNDILYNIINQLEIIVNDLNNHKKIDIIKQIKNIIILVNKVIRENKKNTEQLREDIQKLNKNMINNFEKIICDSKKIYEDGEYIGELKNGLREGKGVFYYNKKNKYERETYKGDWKNDRIEGKGEMTWFSGEKYLGDWKNDMKDGLGIQYNSNKNIEYEGNFSNGLFEGKGVYYYDDGNRYEGDWKNNKREGEGIMYYQKGGKSMGKFLNDLPIGKHVFLQPDGEVTTEFLN